MEEEGTRLERWVKISIFSLIVEMTSFLFTEGTTEKLLPVPKLGGGAEWRPWDLS